MADADPAAPHRRDFVRALALGVPAGLLAPMPPARADDEPEKKDEPTPKPSEADARMALVLARFGDRLDDDARKAVRSQVESQVRAAEALRKFELDNGDGPYPVFVPFRAPPG